MVKYYMTNQWLPESLDRKLVVSIDMTPTHFYYGSITLSQPVDADEMGFVLAEPAIEEWQSECAAVYRAEMRC